MCEAAGLDPLSNRPIQCRLDDISGPGAKGVVLGHGASALDVVVVRAGAGLKAYFNACPHRGTPLATFPDLFLDSSRRTLVCSNPSTSKSRTAPLDWLVFRWVH